MSDLIEVIYRLRDMAGKAADKLRAEIAQGQAVLDRLEEFATHAEDGAQLIAASDLHPNYSASIPDGAGLVHPETNAKDTP